MVAVNGGPVLRRKEKTTIDASPAGNPPEKRGQAVSGVVHMLSPAMRLR